MRIDKELNHLRTHFLEHKEAQKPSFLKGSLRAYNRFLPFLLGVNIGWVLSICIWKFCTKRANKSGLTVSEWIEERLFFSFRSDKAADASSETSSDHETSKPDSDKRTTDKKQASKASKPLSSGVSAVKAEKHASAASPKGKKAPAKKAKSSAKKTALKTASAKTAEKKAPKKSARVEKSAKKSAAASKANKKTTNKSDDKGPS